MRRTLSLAILAVFVSVPFVPIAAAEPENGTGSGTGVTWPLVCESEPNAACYETHCHIDATTEDKECVTHYCILYTGVIEGITCYGLCTFKETSERFCHH